MTYLAGRYLEIKVYPLSFSEYLDFKGVQKTDFKLTDFDSYISNGSFPAIAPNENDELVQTINQGLFDSISTPSVSGFNLPLQLNNSPI